MERNNIMGILGIIEKEQRKLKERIRSYIGTGINDPLFDRAAIITDIYLPALAHHQTVFPKYKNINKGKTVVIVGGGPTLDYYEPISNAIHIAINYTVRRQDIQFAYCFTSDYDAKDALEFYNELMSYGDSLISFFGINYRRVKALIPEFICARDYVEWYYVDSYDWGMFGQNFDKVAKFFYPLDISTSPFKSYGTTMFCALQFALWTHPDKIYLVGADCSNGHANNIGYTLAENFDFTYLVTAWEKSEEFIKAYYPDIEVVSINPVGLKGLFQDEYTELFKRTIK